MVKCIGENVNEKKNQNINLSIFLPYYFSTLANAQQITVIQRDINTNFTIVKHRPQHTTAIDHYWLHTKLKEGDHHEKEVIQSQLKIIKMMHNIFSNECTLPYLFMELFSTVITEILIAVHFRRIVNLLIATIHRMVLLELKNK